MISIRHEIDVLYKLSANNGIHLFEFWSDSFEILKIESTASNDVCVLLPFLFGRNVGKQSRKFATITIDLDKTCEVCT